MQAKHSILLNMKNIELALGGYSVFNGINCRINNSDKIALIGRNGEGKTTFLKLISGDIEQDKGDIYMGNEIDISYLPQNVPIGTDKPVLEFILDGAGKISELIGDYNEVGKKLSEGESKFLFEELDRLNNLIELNGGWEIEKEAKEILERFNLEKNAKFATLSAGKKRIVLLARAIISKPDLLLLDEPTNHLDIRMILWLEEFINNFKGAVLFVTHDRALIEKTATRIMEIDRGQLLLWNCSYSEYLKRKEDSLIIEEKTRELFLKKLSEEEIWIRRGIKARRTRNEGRVKKLLEMREEKENMRTASKSANFSIQDAKLSGKTVLKAKDISYSYGDKKIIDNFSLKIFRGDRIGIVGPNGCGKTTLIKLLLKELKTDDGIIELGTNLQIRHFEQLKDSLDSSRTIVENVGEGSDLLNINGKTKHIFAYLQDFLFSPEKSRSKVGTLSGGEKSRVLLAKLFTLPSNLLIMDEPTNDLDIETLELLEELLLEYKGTLLIVSHDRAFLNNIATTMLVFKENGRIEEYIGGYTDIVEKPIKSKKTSEKKTKKKSKSNKLSYNEQRELNELPEIIERLEEKKEKILNTMAESEFYKQSSENITKIKSELEETENSLVEKYLRWEELEDLKVKYELK